MKSIICSLMLLSIICANSTYGQLHTVPYQDGDQKLNSVLAKPQGVSKKSAGILIIPAWMGIDKHARDVAEDLSELGCYALVADIYGEGNYPKDAKGAGAQAGYYKNNRAAYRHRIELALQQLIKAGADSERIVVIGYCFGGTGALEAARANFPVRGVVSFHGGLSKGPGNTTTIKTHILVCHGADDPNVPADEIKAFQQEMRDAKADWQMVYYGNAVHAFTDPNAGNDNSKGVAYNQKADKRSWQNFLTFLNEVLSDD